MALAKSRAPKRKEGFGREGGEAFLCGIRVVLWLDAKGSVCCACPGSAALEWLVGVKTQEAALPPHTLVAALPGVTIPGHRPCPLALLQLQGLVHDAKIGVDCSI